MQEYRPSNTYQTTHSPEDSPGNLTPPDDYGREVGNEEIPLNGEIDFDAEEENESHLKTNIKKKTMNYRHSKNRTAPAPRLPHMERHMPPFGSGSKKNHQAPHQTLQSPLVQTFRIKKRCQPSQLTQNCLYGPRNASAQDSNLWIRRRCGAECKTSEIRRLQHSYSLLIYRKRQDDVPTKYSPYNLHTPSLHAANSKINVPTKQGPDKNKK